MDAPAVLYDLPWNFVDLQVLKFKGFQSDQAGNKNQNIFIPRILKKGVVPKHSNINIS